MATALKYTDRTLAEAKQLVIDCQTFDGTPQMLPQTGTKYTVICYFEDDPTVAPSSVATSGDAEATVSAAPGAEDRKRDFLSALTGELGKPYIWGKDGPDAYDCSGFVQFALQQVGKDPTGDQNSQMLHAHFSREENGRLLDLEDEVARLGDLAFYGQAGSISHVGVCISAEEMIEAGGGDQTTTSAEAARAQSAEVRKVRIDRRGDLACIIRPSALPW